MSKIHEKLQMTAQLAKEIQEMLKNDEHITIAIPKSTLWILHAQLQLALRHPENIGPSAKIVKDFALQIQDILAPPGTALSELAEAGWNPENDVIWPSYDKKVLIMTSGRRRKGPKSKKLGRNLKRGKIKDACNI